MQFKLIFYFMEFLNIFFYLAPLHYSLIENDIETFKILFNSEDIKPFIKDKHNQTIWHFAAKYGRLEIIKEIYNKTHEHIDECDINNICNYIFFYQTPFIQAAMKGYLDVFNFLKDVKEINVNAKDNEDIFL